MTAIYHPFQNTFRLINEDVRTMALKSVVRAPDGYVVTVKPPGRSLDQNAAFHSLVADIAKAKPEWAGMKMDADDWKALLIVSHAKATGEAQETIRLVPSLEGHGMVQLRESSARMTKARASSLIEYCISWAVSNGVKLSAPQRVA